MTGPRVAVLGCGQWGRNHVRVWQEMGSLGVVCDPSAEALARLDLPPSVERTRDPEATVRRPDVDAVVIATPASTHAALAEQSLRAGKDVLVEKPMAVRRAEGERLVAVAEELGRVLLVGHVLEYHPAVIELLAQVEAGVLGRIRYVYSNRLNLGRIRTEENVLWSFAPHDIGLVLRLAGRLPDSVTCTGVDHVSDRVADVTLTALKFGGDLQAHIFVSWLHPFKEHRFVVIGDRQMATFDDTRPWSEKLTLYPHTVEWQHGRVPVARRADGTPVPLTEREPLRAECEHFVECVRTRGRPRTDGRQGADILAVLDAADQSLRTGTAVSVGAEAPYYVHPTATVDEGARIGRGSKVWHYSHVMGSAVIGERCILGQNVFVAGNVRIGDGVKIQNNVSVYEGVELDDDVFCGPSMVFTNVNNPRSAIERKDQFRPTRVGKGASLGANCTIVCGATIGRYAFVGAGALVRGHVPDYALVVGVPARQTGWMCACGEKLTLQGAAARCAACDRGYRLTDGALRPE